MKKILMSLAALMVLMAATPAHACKCAPDAGGAQAQALMSDPSISVAKVLVRGMNTRNGQSMLELKQTISGGLMARNFRAKFDNKTSCGVTPNNRQTEIHLIKFEKDGTYSLMGDCARTNVLQYLNKQ